MPLRRQRGPQSFQQRRQRLREGVGRVSPISAQSVTDALSKAQIKRRVIIISACYSGSWIPSLASPDSIVITAASKDRTSFGCDDSRQLTYFGEAFLNGPLSKGASLRDSFETARRKLAAWEVRDHLTPSQPQAYVGANMQALWRERTRLKAPFASAASHN
jgi:Peptidase C13 family